MPTNFNSGGASYACQNNCCKDESGAKKDCYKILENSYRMFSARIILTTSHVNYAGYMNNSRSVNTSFSLLEDVDKSLVMLLISQFE